MAEVIDITKHPRFRNKRVTDQPESQEPALDSEEITAWMCEITTLETDILVQELLSHFSKGTSIRGIPRDLIVMELAIRLESYSQILEEALQIIDLES
jgi:hypothetical protein